MRTSRVARNNASSTLCVMKKMVLPVRPQDVEHEFLHRFASECVECAHGLVPSAGPADRWLARGRCLRAAACRRKARTRVASAYLPRPTSASMSRAISRRRVRPTPWKRSPSATLSSTSSHGISAYFWKTTPRSARGPCDRFAIQSRDACRRIDEACETIQQGCLAASRSAERDDEHATVDLQIDAFECGRRRAFIGHAKAANLECAHFAACCTKRGSTPAE